MTITDGILLGLRIAEAIASGIPEAVEAKRVIDVLLAQGRDPTDAEWERLTATTDALHRRVQEGRW